MTQSPSPNPDSITLHADKEHGGIRLSVPLIMLLAAILCFLLVDRLALAPLLNGGDWEGFRPFLRILLSVVLGVIVGGGAEAFLKRRWKSGRFLRLEDGALTIQEKNIPAQRIEWNKRVNILRWRFTLRGYPRGGRERRITTGHHLLACRLLQDDVQVTFFCYLSSKRTAEVPGIAKFVTIDMAKLYGSNLLSRFSRPERPSIPAKMLSSKQGQIWAAEKGRWETGFEMEPSDFVTLMSALDRFIPLQAG